MKHRIIRAIVIIAIFDILIVAGGLVAVIYFQQSAAYFAFSMITLALVTFFGFIIIGVKPNENPPISSSVLRMSITIAVVALYLSVVALTTFLRNWSDDIQPLTQNMLSNFNTIVGVVIAFYFTSSVYIEGVEKKKNKSDNQS
jgi:hypothetical protein